MCLSLFNLRKCNIQSYWIILFISFQFIYAHTGSGKKIARHRCHWFIYDKYLVTPTLHCFSVAYLELQDPGVAVRALDIGVLRVTHLIRVVFHTAKVPVEGLGVAAVPRFREIQTLVTGEPSHISTRSASRLRWRWLLVWLWEGCIERWLGVNLIGLV